MEDIMQETLSDWLGIVYPFYCTLLYISSDTIHNVCCVSFFFLCHVSKCKVKTSNSLLTRDMEVNQSWANQPFKCSNRTRLEGGMNKLLGSEDNSFLYRAKAETRQEGLLANKWRFLKGWSRREGYKMQNKGMEMRSIPFSFYNCQWCRD